MKINLKLFFKKKETEDIIVDDYDSIGYVFVENLVEVNRHSHKVKSGNLVIDDMGRIGKIKYINPLTYEVAVKFPWIDDLSIKHMTQFYQYIVYDQFIKGYPLSFDQYKLFTFGNKSIRSFPIEYRKTLHGFAKMTDKFMMLKFKQNENKNKNQNKS